MNELTKNQENKLASLFRGGIGKQILEAFVDLVAVAGPEEAKRMLQEEVERIKKEKVIQ